MFFCAGAFPDLGKIIAKRMSSSSIGFDAKIKNDKENQTNINCIEEIDDNSENSIYEKIKFSLCEKTWIFMFNLFCGCF